MSEYYRQMCSLLELKQTGTVAEYKVAFEASMYQMLAFNTNLDIKFFAGQFVSGLRDDIQASVLLKSPSSVTRAVILARIEEAELEHNKQCARVQGMDACKAEEVKERSKQVMGAEESACKLSGPLPPGKEELIVNLQHPSNSASEVFDEMPSNAGEPLPCEEFDEMSSHQGRVAGGEDSGDNTLLQTPVVDPAHQVLYGMPHEIELSCDKEGEEGDVTPCLLQFQVVDAALKVFDELPVKDVVWDEETWHVLHRHDEMLDWASEGELGYVVVSPSFKPQEGGEVHRLFHFTTDFYLQSHDHQLEVYYSFACHGVSVVHEWNGVSKEFVSFGLRHRLDGVCLVLDEMPPWSRSAFSPGNSQIESACWVLEKILSWRRSGFSPGSEITMAQIILEFTNEEDVPLIILSAPRPWDPGVFPSVTSEKWIDQVISTKNKGTFQLLKYNGQEALFSALQRVKEELMLLGFISFLLSVFQNFINHISIPESAADLMLPCIREISKAIEDATKLCKRKGEVPMLSEEALHQLHIFIFVLGVDSSTAGLVQSSFFWGYTLSQLPGGWLAKLFGGRRVLEIGVVTWSLATAITPVVAGFMQDLCCPEYPETSTLVGSKLREFHNLDMPCPETVLIWDRLKNWLKTAKNLCSSDEANEFRLDSLENEITALEKEFSGTVALRSSIVSV